MMHARLNSLRPATILASLFALSMLVVPVVSAHSASIQAKQDFTLHNSTGLEITELYVSQSDKDDWESDILGRDVLASGESVDITFGREAANFWDMKVVFSNGKSSVWSKLNLSKLTDITISFKDGKPWATSK